jgi:hypothetical protein
VAHLRLAPPAAEWVVAEPLRADPNVARLKLAYGEVRDALGAIKGFATLLRSSKVSPRNLESSLEDVEAGCARLVASAAQCTTLVEAKLGAGCTGDLLKGIQHSAAALQTKVRAAKPMNAARRIDLEHTTLAVLADLESSLMLIELVKEAAVSDPISVDLTSLLSPGRGSDPDLQPTKRTVLAQAVVHLSEHEFLVKPRVATLVLAYSVAFVTGENHNRCLVRIADAPNGGFSITIEGQIQATGMSYREIEIAVPRVLPASEICCKTAARTCIAEVHWEHDPKRAVLSWAAH